MNLFSLNVRGLRNKNKRQLLFNFLVRQNSDLILLQETFWTEELEKTIDKEWGSKIMHSFGNAHSRGVSILVRKGVHFQTSLIHTSNDGRLVVVKVEVDEVKILLTNVYAPTEKKNKHSFFKSVQRCFKNIENFESFVLIMGGDFNCINNASLDTIGCKTVYKRPKEYITLLEAYNMVDIWRKMHRQEKQFTYRNKFLKMASRIDFWLVQKNFVDFVQRTSIKPVSVCPDHCAIALVVSVSKVLKGPSYWKLNNSLLKHDSYKAGIRNIIQNVKIEYILENSTQYMWDMCKLKIRDFTVMFSKKLVINERKAVNELECKLKKLYDQSTRENDETTEEELLNVQQELNTYYKKLCDGARVRARVTQFEEGETNSKYFLGLEKRNGVKQSISSLRIGGKIKYDKCTLLKFVKKYYSNLYKSVECNDSFIDEYLTNIDTPRLSDIEANFCEGPITIDEATKALKDMKINKSPGLDGLSVEFYREFWPEIQDIVVRSFNDAFSEGHLSYLQRKGVISLLFKGGDKEELDNWRPITLLNIDYKILAMVLTKRLQKVLPGIINEDQVGYIKGRSGIYNARLVQDVIDYHTLRDEDAAIIYADFRKAFDTLEWNFIDKCLQLYGFKESFRKWILVLYSNPNLVVQVDGWFTETIEPSRGVRQGCPLSALLFILGIEVLSNRLRQEKNIKGIFIENDDTEIKVTQLADDMTLFVKDVKSGEKAIDIVEEFEKISGVHLNRNKTKAMWLGNTCPRDTIKNISWCDTFVKSLGIYFCKNKILSLELNWSQERFEKIQQILSSWKQRNLSLKGKIIILKTLVISRLIYTAQVLSCPKGWIKKYETMFYTFLWGNSVKVKKRNLINPVQNGGLNMIDTYTQFNSLRLKWLFTFLSCRESHEKRGKWTVPFAYWIQEVGGIDILMNCNCLPKYVLSCKDKLPEFYCDLLYTWFTVKGYRKDNPESSYDNILREMIWLNNNIKFEREFLLYKNWVKSDILFIGDIVKGNSFLNVDNLRCKLRYKDGRWLSEYTKILASIPARWRYVIINDKQANDRNFNLFRRKCLIYSSVRLLKKDILIHSATVKEIYGDLVKLEQLPSRVIVLG